MGGAGSEWWQTRRFAALSVLLSCVPLLWPTFPPLTDVLGHAGRYRVMLDGGSGLLAQWFGFEWRLAGNLGADVLVAALGPLVGLEAAVRVVVVAAVASTASGLIALSRVAHGRVSPFALFALPLAYNHAFHTGFLNFALAMGLALNALAVWLAISDRRWRAAMFVPIALIVWGTHAFGWAVLALTAFAAEWAKDRRPVAAALSCWPLAAPLPLMLLWRAGSSGATFGFLDVQAKLLAIMMIFRDRWLNLDVATLIVVLVVIALGARRCRVSAPLAWGAAALALAFIALPTWLMGSAFADMRAAPFIWALALVALAPVDARQARIIAIAGLAFFLARTAATTASLALAGARQEAEAVALDHLPVGSRVALFVSADCRDPWRMARLDHIGGLATARRRSFVNDQWTDVGASLMTTHYPAAGAFQNDPSQLLPCDGGPALARRIAALPRSAFDRLWLVAIPEGVPPALPGMTRVWADGNSAVFAISHRRLSAGPPAR